MKGFRTVDWDICSLALLMNLLNLILTLFYFLQEVDGQSVKRGQSRSTKNGEAAKSVSEHNGASKKIDELKPKK